MPDRKPRSGHSKPDQPAIRRRADTRTSPPGERRKASKSQPPDPAQESVAEDTNQTWTRTGSKSPKRRK